MQVQGTISGRMDDPEAQANVQAVNLVYRHLPMDTLTASLDFSGGKLYVSQATFEGAMMPVDIA